MYIQLNGTTIPNPVQWKETRQTISSVNQTEGGKDVVDYTRRDKIKVAAKFKCTSDWASFFFNCKDADVSVTRYEMAADDYVTKTMRMDNFVANMVKKSYKIDDTVSHGLWEITFDLIEY